MPSGVYKHKKGYKREPYSEEWKQKISNSLKGRSVWNTGLKNKQVAWNKGIKTGLIPWNKGIKGIIKQSKETIEKRLETFKKIGYKPKPPIISGEKSHLWKGGITNVSYSVDWTETLRRSIRERDHYVCQMCGKEQGDISHAIHHIDYNKKNCNPENLITLCNSCHVKTNGNREYWKEYFASVKTLKGLAIASAKTKKGLA
jgi:hypothetical protein